MSKIISGLTIYLGPGQIFKMKTGLKIQNMDDQPIRLKVKTTNSHEMNGEQLFELSPLEIVRQEGLEIQNLKGATVRIMIS